MQRRNFSELRTGTSSRLKQILDYRRNIAANARTSQYVNLANQIEDAGIGETRPCPQATVRRSIEHRSDIPHSCGRR